MFSMRLSIFYNLSTYFYLNICKYNNENIYDLFETQQIYV